MSVTIEITPSAAYSIVKAIQARCRSDVVDEATAVPLVKPRIRLVGGEQISVAVRAVDVANGEAA